MMAGIAAGQPARGDGEAARNGDGMSSVVRETIDLEAEERGRDLASRAAQVKVGTKLLFERGDKEESCHGCENSPSIKGSELNRHGQDNEDDGGQDDVRIPEDSFSIFYVACVERLGAFEIMFPVAVFFVQVTILSLILFNLIQTNGSPLDLKINIPVDVPTEVTIAQYLACVVSVYTAQDFTDGILFVRKRICRGGNYSRLTVGDDERAAEDDEHVPPFSAEWEISNFMRLAEGLLVICVSLVFIVQSTTVIDLFLNFAGVAFVSDLDDVSFKLAKNGFLGTRLSGLAHEVTARKVYSKRRNVHGIRGTTTPRKTARIVSFLIVAMVMFACLTASVMHQDVGHWACKRVTITVGEANFKDYRSYSGTYILSDRTHANRPVYIQKQGYMEGAAFLAYCEEYEGDKINRWTVTSRGKENKCEKDDWHPCCWYELQSERTRTYDITEISGLQYYTGHAVDGDISCSECSLERGSETCGGRGQCKVQPEFVGRGELETKTCDCDDGFFGESCQFKGPCTQMTFQDDEFSGYEKSFDLMYYDGKPLLVHDRPAYVQRDYWGQDHLALLISDGGRWIEVGNNCLSTYNATTASIEEYLSQSFNARTHGHDDSYLSEMSYDGLPANVPFRASLSSSENDQSEGRMDDKEFILLCADCDSGEGGPSNCMNHLGTTDESLCQKEIIDASPEPVNRCKCEHGFIGPLCQTRPVEGEVSLYLDHGMANVCSVCGKDNPWTVWYLLGFNNMTCVPFPREPLVFERGNGTVVSRHLGLNLNLTHFSVFVAESEQFFPYEDNDMAPETICSGEGSRELFSIRRNGVRPSDKTSADFAILLDQDNDFFGKNVDAAEIDCFASHTVDESVCDASKEGSFLKNLTFNEDVQKSELLRAWIQLDLEVTQ